MLMMHTAGGLNRTKARKRSLNRGCSIPMAPCHEVIIGKMIELQGEDRTMVEHLCEKFGLTRGEVVRRAVRIVFEVGDDLKHGKRAELL